MASQGLCKDTCVDARAGVCKGADTCVGVFVGMCVGTCTDMSVDPSIDVCVGMCDRHDYKDSINQPVSSGRTALAQRKQSNYY